MPQVAIITRTHNRALLLQRALKTVGAQTFSDYAHVIVNDAGEREPVEALVAGLPETGRNRTEVIHNEVSAGREAAVNPGFDRARALGAKYAVVLDDDDSWEPEFLARTVAHLEEHGEDVAVATRTTVVYEEISADGGSVTERDRGPLAPEKNTVALEDILKVNWVPPVSLLFRVASLETLTGWREDLPVLADWDFFLRMLLIGPIGFIDTPLANWHHRQQQSGDLGNSVVVEAENHRDFHAVLRDEALRGGTKGGAESGLAPLAPALLMAHYAKELVEKNRELTNELKELHEAQSKRDEEIKDYLATLIERSRADNSKQLGEVGDSILDLHRRLDAMGFRARLRRLFNR